MVTQRSLLERDALFARWQKAIIVNLGQLGDARQAECFSNLEMFWARRSRSFGRSRREPGLPRSHARGVP